MQCCQTMQAARARDHKGALSQNFFVCVNQSPAIATTVCFPGANCEKTQKQRLSATGDGKHEIPYTPPSLSGGIHPAPARRLTRRPVRPYLPPVFLTRDFPADFSFEWLIIQ